MTQLLQPGQHPDADQLSAFAEHALPPHEQQQTLAHLATCADCRAIVYLAEPDPVEAPTPKPTATRRPWFSGWNLALPATVAFAALVLVTVHLRKAATGQHQAAADKTAHLDKPAPPPTPPASNTSAPYEAAAKKQPAQVLKPGAAPLVASAPAELKVAPPPASSSIAADRSSEATESTPPMSGARLGPQTVERQSLALDKAPPPVTAPLNGLSSAKPQQQIALSRAEAPIRELHSSAMQYNSVAGAVSNSQAAQAVPTPPPPTARSIQTQTVNVSNASANLQTESTASSQVIANQAYAPLPEVTRKLKRQISLPSHRPVVSTAANAQQQIAIDTTGALFRSQNAGVTWQPIAAQWPGRAVKLQLTPQPTPPSLAKSANAPPQAAPPQAVFELTTDAGQIWTSTDGQTWTRK